MKTPLNGRFGNPIDRENGVGRDMGAIFHPGARYWLPATVLLVLGCVDLLRGVLHTFFVDRVAKVFARLDLTTARQDQLTLLGVFGISNLLTGALFLLVSVEAPQLAAWVLLAVPCVYAFGMAGIRSAGVRREAAFLGRYFMLVYLGVCVLTFLVSRFQS
jgi:hypothetical protein